MSARLAGYPALECGNRGSNQPQAVARRRLQPACDREAAVGPQMVEILLERLDRVDVALAEAVRACGRRRKGVEEGNLDQVVAVAPAGDKASRLRDMDPHARARVKMARESGKALGDEPHELWVELDRVDRLRIVQQGEQDVGSAAGAEDQNVGLLQEMIGQRRRRGIEIVERLAPAVEGGDRGESVAVGKDAELG